MKRFLLPLGVLVLMLACGSAVPTPDRQATLRAALYPSPTPDATQTPVLVEITKVVQITVTPQPTAKPTMTRQIKLCVTAIETVYLRPSASERNYPITTLTNGVEVMDRGGRDGEWIFVEVGDKQGWIHSKYIKPCR
jgi:hypothetical protein